MLLPSSSNTDIANKHGIPLYLVLIAAGLAGNHFSFHVFLDVEFIFGSIFAMLALQFFGLARGILAAGLIAGYTWFSWNNPYAIITMTAEVAVVGLLMERRRVGLVLADALYWLLAGMPLAYLFCHIVIDAPLSTTHIIMSKQALNGIANALAARLIFIGYAHSTRTLLISYREIVYNLLAFFVLCPALIILTAESRDEFNETDLRIRTSLVQESQRLEQRLNTWMENRKPAIVALSGMAATRTPQQMQPYLELTKRSDVNFLRVALIDKHATTTACFPLTDEQGHGNIGKNYPDHPYLPALKQKLTPMLSDVMMSRTGSQKPIVALLAPMIIRGEFDGYIAGILGLEQIQAYLETSMNRHTTLYTLLDKNGAVIMTNRTDQTVMTPFVRGKGSLERIDNEISQWLPAVPPNTPYFERWKQSFYVVEKGIGILTEWRLVLEQPVAQYQKSLNDHVAGHFSLLFLILLGALALAECISRKVVVAIGELRTLTYELPDRLTSDGALLEWPDSSIKEAKHLINNFREMANSLSRQFIEIRHSNESLEQRVEERTEELRKSEEAYRTVADFTHDWEYWLAPDGTLRYMSPSCERHTGYRCEEFLKDSGLMRSIIHPDDRKQYDDHLQDVLDTSLKESQHHTDFRITARSGEVRWFAHVCQPVNDSGGKYLGQRASNRDITDRKQAEEALARSKALYHSLVEASQDLIWRCDSEGRYTFLNLAWEQLFGYDREEMLGRKFSDFQTPEHAAYDLEKFSRLMEGESVDRYETTYIGKYGNEIHLVFNALFMCDDSGEITGASGTAYDITLRRQMEEEFRQARACADAANDAKSRFLATMSHEIRTPMNGVIGMIELLQHTGLTPEQEEYAASAKNSGIVLVGLLNDILDLSKIEADRIELETSDFDLRQVISDIIRVLSIQARNKGVALSFSLDADVPVALRGDSGRLRQILINLIGNALKFTPKGAVSLQVRKDAEEGGHTTLRFLVLDSGIGIAADKLDHIFEPFTQADSSTTRAYGGTGLGLTICRRLAELMGGKIGALSTENAGSTFWFTVVMEQQNSAPSLEGRTQTAGLKGLGDGDGANSAESSKPPPIRILLADDDPTARKIVPLLLKNYDYRVDVAESGGEALRMLRENDYALVLMDCMMPEMNGFEVTARIREPASAVRRHDIPVIALTGNALKQDRDRCVDAGMNDHLAKPLVLADLLAMLEKWLKSGVEAS